MTAGQNFLPELPNGWRSGRLLEVAETRTSNIDKHSVDGQQAVRLCNYVDVYYNETITQSIDYMRASATDVQIDRFRIFRGDTLITKDSESADDIGIPAFVDYQSGDLVCGYHLAIVRPRQDLIEPKYIFWVMRSAPTLRQWTVRATGVTRVGIKAGDLARAAIPIPPRNEQRAIADYLDRETQKIDELITEQRGLIETLRERRHSLRTEVALRGIDGERTSWSSLPWARSLPESWQVVPLSAVSSIESGHTPSRSRPEWWTDTYIPWISLHDVSNMRTSKYVQSTVHQVSDAGIANSSARILPAGTVVLSRDATVGRTAIMSVPMATSQHFGAWICGHHLNPEYLWVLFSDAMQAHFESFQNGATLRTIGMNDMKSFRIPLPPIEEQSRIVEYLDVKTARIDELISESEDLITLSQERRAALITAAVTGQIDVSEAA